MEIAMSSKISYKGKKGQISKRFSFIEGGHQLEKLEFALAVAQSNGDGKKSKKVQAFRKILRSVWCYGGGESHTEMAMINEVDQRWSSGTDHKTGIRKTISFELKIWKLFLSRLGLNEKSGNLEILAFSQ